MSRLDGKEATRYLGQLDAGVPAVPEELGAVIDAAGGLRLALSVLSATASVEGDWGPVVARLEGLATRFGRGDDASSAQKAAHVAMLSLAPLERERLWTLARFPADEPVPLALLNWLWGTDATALAGTLHERSLATLTGDDLEVHDHFHDHLVLAAPPSDVHERLWRRASDIVANDGWQALADREPYLWERLVWHGCRAQIRAETLTAAGADVTRLALRIRRKGTPAAEADLAAVCGTAAHTPDSPVGKLARVTHHGPVLDTARRDAGLELSLRLWAEAVGRAARPSGALVGSLPVPSASLLRTLTGRTGEVLGVAFDPSGTRLATASADGTARIWDPTNGETLLTLALACSGYVAWTRQQLAIAAGSHWAAIDAGLIRDTCDQSERQEANGEGPSRRRNL